jgi:hypothetical protein
MFQVFRMFHWYVVIVSDECCNGCTRMLQRFIRNVPSVFFDVLVHLSGYCIYFTHILQVFYVDIVYVCNVFRRMLQALHLDVSKVDRVLHMLQSA